MTKQKLNTEPSNSKKPVLANRILQFRAWDKACNKMRGLKGVSDLFGLRSDGDCNLDFILMQNTGIKTIDEKYIFEGDIIKIPDDYDTYGMNAGEEYVIYFAYGGFRCVPKYNKNAKGTWLEDNGEFEVIGNIYENANLIPETSY
jgi:uncharacterized phage protein (TIGR01671 family)